MFVFFTLEEEQLAESWSGPSQLSGNLLLIGPEPGNSED